LKFTAARTKIAVMTAAKVIEEMDGLPPDEQAKVIQHAFELAATASSARTKSAIWPNDWPPQVIRQKSFD